MTRTLITFSLCLAAWGGIARADDADIQRPSRPAMIFETTSGPRPELPATRPATGRPTTRPSRVSVRIPEAPLPPATLRRTAVVFNEQRPPLTANRQPAEAPNLFAEADPPRPGQPVLAAAPRYSVPTVYEPWLPLPYLMKLRMESPVRAHEPVLDPMGGSKMSALPIFRSTPLAAQRNAIPNPFENAEAVKLLDPPADDDPPASSPSTPAIPPMPVEKMTLPIPPATQPATRP